MPLWTASHPALADQPAVQIRWTPSSSTALADPIVDLVTLRTFVNRALEDTFWDDELQSFLYVAQDAIETYCEITLPQTTFVGTLPAFYNRIRITKRPFISVTSIEYVDRLTGNILTVDPTTYQVAHIAQDCGMILLGDGCAWPDAARRLDAVRITIEAGFASGLPQPLLHALKMTVAALDNDRGESSGSTGRQTVYAMKQMTSGVSIIPRAAHSILQRYVYRRISI
jgi:hypothetical protein